MQANFKVIIVSGNERKKVRLKGYMKGFTFLINGWYFW
jgi:hypothetical protein